ncbi:MAG: hypothetical protein RIC95_09365 [Vicingaceae bacterium]
MKNITYLLGAGASYHSLPLLATMNNRLNAYSTYLKIAIREGVIKNEFALQFVTELDKLIKAAHESTSIDAYAKELSNSNKHLELLHLKALLSSYLIFEQLVKPEDFKLYVDESKSNEYDKVTSEMITTHLDKRYRTFWGNYATNKGIITPNVRILSWNYDMQLEFSFSRYSQFSLEYVQQELQVFPSEQKKVNLDKFCILKLNGTAGLLDTYGNSTFTNLFDLNKHHLNSNNLNYLIDILKDNYYRAFSNPVFSFAWENKGVAKKTRELAKTVIETSDILVIIGYSFPSFNRDIDRSLFKDLGRLDKVYYQAPQQELNYLKYQAIGVNNEFENKIIGIPILDSFYIPPEF